MPTRGRGRAWGGNLIVFVGPGVRYLTDLALPGKAVFQCFFTQGALGSIERFKIQWNTVNMVTNNNIGHKNLAVLQGLAQIS